ncbi:YeeE/YedE family protein [Phycisphaerales bacterium AB-hyl4]|uniref:YeeE/YedE family protein n=1 Tax=Natronomicrosphaera hydrolytica TaxID=3242702 RepID=A0ABV4U0R4_9BACT
MTQMLNQPRGLDDPGLVTDTRPPRRPSVWWFVVRLVVAAMIAAGLVWVGLWLQEHQGRAAAFTLVTGVAFGVMLQRSQFCFFCNLRDLLQRGDSGPTMGLLAALATGTVGYVVVMGSMMPDPTRGWGIPGDAHVAPVSWVMLMGGAIFGVGMSLSGSCLSGHLYRMGEGSLLAPIAIVGAFGGFVLGFMAWNPLYLRVISDASVVWLPETVGGYGVTLLVQLGVLGLIAIPLLYLMKPRAGDAGKPGVRRAVRMVFVNRWPTWVGGVGIGILGTFTYLRTRPLGVTAEMNRYARDLGERAGMTPERLEGLDRMRGCVLPEQAAWVSENGIFVLALVAGSLMVALLAGQFRLKREPWVACVMALVGGVMLGFGAMIALGCTVGTLLSGIHAGALAGWVFFAGMLPAMWVTLPLRRWLLRW